MDVDHAGGGVRPLGGGAGYPAQQVNARDRIGWKITQRCEIADARAVDQNHWHVGPCHVDGAASPTSLDSARTPVPIFVEVVAPGASAEEVPGVGESGVGDLLGAERLSAICRQLPRCARWTHATAERGSGEKKNE